MTNQSVQFWNILPKMVKGIRPYLISMIGETI